jgi:hypothetical protein
MSIDDGPGPFSGSAQQITGLHAPKMAAPQFLIAHNRHLSQRSHAMTLMPDLSTHGNPDQSYTAELLCKDHVHDLYNNAVVPLPCLDHHDGHGCLSCLGQIAHGTAMTHAAGC